MLKKFLTMVSVGLIFLAVGCSAEADSAAPASSSSASSSVDNPGGASPANSASPLSGVKGYSQKDSDFTPVAGLTEEDRQRAISAAEDGMRAFVSGKEYKEWSEELYPLMSPELQNRYGEGTPTQALKSEVRGHGEIVQDPTVDEGNLYTLRVKVVTGLGDYYLLMHRNADRPQTWKITALDTSQEYDMYVKEHTVK